MYKKFLSKNKYIKFQETSEKNKNTYWMVGILNLSKKISKNSLMKKLKLKGIETRSFFFPINKQPCFKKFIKIENLIPQYQIICGKMVYIFHRVII